MKKVKLIAAYFFIAICIFGLLLILNDCINFNNNTLLNFIITIGATSSVVSLWNCIVNSDKMRLEEIEKKLDKLIELENKENKN